MEDKRVKGTTIKNYKKNNKTIGHFCYILEFGRTNIVTKVGMTSHLTQRMNQLKKKYGTPRILALYNFDNVEDAYIMEVLLHKYFKQKNIVEFIPQDRFLGRVFFQTDLPILESVAEELRGKKWF